MMAAPQDMVIINAQRQRAHEARKAGYTAEREGAAQQRRYFVLRRSLWRMGCGPADSSRRTSHAWADCAPGNYHYSHRSRPASCAASSTASTLSQSSSVAAVRLAPRCPRGACSGGYSAPRPTIALCTAAKMHALLDFSSRPAAAVQLLRTAIQRPKRTAVERPKRATTRSPRGRRAAAREAPLSRHRGPRSTNRP